MWDNSPVLSPTNECTNQLKKIDSNVVADCSTSVTTSQSNISYLPKELRKYERCRLDSFKTWPTESGMDPKRLAKAGFFSTGIDDEVECFSCGGILRSWKFGDVAIVKHKENFPKCTFIGGKSANVPLNAVSSTLITKSNQNRNDNKSGFINTAVSSNTPQFVNKKCNTSSIDVQGAEKQKANIKDMGPLLNGIQYHNKSSALTNADTHDGPFPKDHLSDYVKNSSAPAQFNYEKFKREDERLKTFKSGWPTVFISPADLAKAGFFFTFSQDKVQCAFCHGIVGHWDRGDVPLTEHARHFPLCPYLLNYDVGNVPIASGSDTGAVRDLAKGYDVTGIYASASELPRTRESDRKVSKDHSKNYEELGIISQHVKPRYPAQAVIDARLRSFNNPDHPWPSDSPLAPEPLAQAGFFYTGVNDSTRCFHCNGGLTNWVKGDDPWTEHARWFPKCNYVKLNKGDQFIQDSTEKFPPIQQPINAPLNGQAKLALQIEDLMNSSVVTQVLEMGLPEQSIRNALQQQLTSTGAAFSSATELYSAIQNVSSDSHQPMSSAEQLPSSSNVTHAAEWQSEDVVGTTQHAEDIANESIAAMTLEEENRVLKEQKMCKICMDHEIGVVFLPCGHFICCTQCAPALTDCPVCRKNIKETLKRNITNTAVLQRIGLQETSLLQSILKRKTSFFGHIAKGSTEDELKMIVAEGRTRRWMDDVELVTGTAATVEIAPLIVQGLITFKMYFNPLRFRVILTP